MKRLYRSRTNKVIAGVCGGIGEYFDVDPVLIRLIWIMFVFIGLSGVLAYIIAWIVIPKDPMQSKTLPNQKRKKHSS